MTTPTDAVLLDLRQCQRRARKGLIDEGQLESFVRLIDRSESKAAQIGNEAIVLETAQLVAETYARDFADVHERFHWAKQQYSGPVTIVEYAKGIYSVGREPGEFFRDEQYAGFAKLSFRIKRQLSMANLRAIRPLRLDHKRSCLTKDGRAEFFVDIFRL